MYKYVIYGVFEKDKSINFINSFEDFSEAFECLYLTFVEELYTYDGYLIKYEWCW